MQNSWSIEYHIRDLGTSESSFNVAYDINDSGQVTGIKGYPFVWQNGSATYFGIPGVIILPNAINISGQVVGYYTPAYSQYHAFLWQNRVMQDLGTLGGTNSYAYGINDTGQVVGYSATTGGYNRAFLWQSGVMEDLGTLGGLSSAARAINNNAQVVGGSSTAGGSGHAFLWQNEAMTDLGTLPGSSSSSAYGINSFGQVVGYSYFEDGPYYRRAFMWQNGTMQDLGTLGGDSHANDINDNGQVVGWSYTTGGSSHAFLWQNGVMTDLGILGGNSSYAYAINSNGVIAGSVDFGTAGIHAVLWEPIIPEPSSLLALAGGLAGIAGLVVRRRRR